MQTFKILLFTLLAFSTNKVFSESFSNETLEFPLATTQEVTTTETTSSVATSIPTQTKERFTGFFIGINIGGLINRSYAHVNPAGSFLDRSVAEINALKYHMHFNNGGFTGGAQIGYHYQYKFFFCGLETDFDYSSLSKTVSVTRACTSPVVGNITYRVTHKVLWYGTLRPKLGIAFNPIVIYASGGLAYGNIKSSTYLYYDVDYGEYNGSISKTKTGWTVGGGLGWNFAKHWFVNLDYLFVDFGKNRYSDTPATTSGYYQTTDIKTMFHAIRTGLNYLF